MAADRRNSPQTTDEAQSSRGSLLHYTPKRFGEDSRQRFRKHRRNALVERVGGDPNARQALIIERMVACEWAELRAEHDAEVAGDPRHRIEFIRIASDARRQMLLWNRELTAATPPPPAAAPAPSLDRHLEMLRARRRTAGEAA